MLYKTITDLRSSVWNGGRYDINKLTPTDFIGVNSDDVHILFFDSTKTTLRIINPPHKFVIIL